MIFTWKQRCRQAAQFLEDYTSCHRENRDYAVILIAETVSGILNIPIPNSITPQETSCRIMELILDFEYKQSEEVLFPTWLNQSREERLAFLEQDYGKFYEAVYKFDSDEQRWRLRMVEDLLIFREETQKSFPYLRFFDSLKGYLQCASSVKKDEMQLFLEKSLSAVWGVYLEKQEDI